MHVSYEYHHEMLYFKNVEQKQTNSYFFNTTRFILIQIIEDMMYKRVGIFINSQGRS